MKEFIKVMKALSNPNRVKILKMLEHRVMCVSEIQAALGLAQSTVSKHLKVLNGAGLVSYRKNGLWAYYHLPDGRDSPYAATLMDSLGHWLERDQQVIDLLKKLPTIPHVASGKNKDVSYATEGVQQRHLTASV